jgi:hypothetical protein
VKPSITVSLRLLQIEAKPGAEDVQLKTKLMSRKLVDHLLTVNYRGITEKIKSFKKPNIKPKTKSQRDDR